jgi:hypothetical protein
MFCLVWCVVVELSDYCVECLNYILFSVIKCNPTLVDSVSAQVLV